MAFDNCTALEEISIPDTVVNIPTRAFYGCTALVDFEPHKNLKSVALDALEGSGWENAQPDGALAFGRICYGYKGDITNLVNKENGVEYASSNFVAIPTVISDEETDTWAHNVFKFHNVKGFMELQSIKRIEEGASASAIAALSSALSSSLRAD